MSSILGNRLRHPEGSDVYDSPSPAVTVDSSQYAEPPTPTNSHEQSSIVLDSGEQLDEANLLERFTTAAETIVPALNNPLENGVREQLDEWCGMHDFGTIESKQSQRLVARQAVFAYWLKAALYEWYQQRGDLPLLTGDLQDAFDHAKTQTGHQGFDKCVLDDVAALADESALTSVVETRHELLESGAPAAEIGRLYEALTEDESRYRLGQYHTPREVGRLMRLWAADGDTTVLDPGIGPGVLSAPFHPNWVVSTDPAHVYGIEQSPLSALMGTTALTLYGQDHRVVEADFLSLSAEDIQQEIEALVCNPPYTSGDALPAEEKQQINQRIEEVTGLDVSMRSPLYAYFLYLAPLFLAPGGRAAFLTPQDFLATKYGHTLKHFLKQEFDIKALVQFDPDGEALFETAESTALLLFLDMSADSATGGETRFIRVDEKPGPATLRNAVNSGVEGSTAWGRITCIDQVQLDPEANWQALFSPCGIETDDSAQLGDFATITRGVNTGAVDVFCLTQADIDEYGISDQHVSKLIRRPAVLDGYEFRDNDWQALQSAGEKVWLLDPDELHGVPDSVAAFEEALATEHAMLDDDLQGIHAYLRDCVQEHDLSERTTLEDRPLWYRIGATEPPQVLVPDAGRDGFPFILNETDAHNVHNFRGISDITLPDRELKALLAYLNSHVGQQLIKRHARTQQGGYGKLPVRALKTLPVIDPTQLEKGSVDALAEAFDELRRTVRHGENEQSVLDKIDSLLSLEE